MFRSVCQRFGRAPHLPTGLFCRMPIKFPGRTVSSGFFARALHFGIRPGSIKDRMGGIRKIIATAESEEEQEHTNPNQRAAPICTLIAFGTMAFMIYRIIKSGEASQKIEKEKYEQTHFHGAELSLVIEGIVQWNRGKHVAAQQAIDLALKRNDRVIKTSDFIAVLEILGLQHYHMSSGEMAEQSIGYLSRQLYNCTHFDIFGCYKPKNFTLIVEVFNALELLMCPDKLSRSGILEKLGFKAHHSGFVEISVEQDKRRQTFYENFLKIVINYQGELFDNQFQQWKQLYEYLQNRVKGCKYSFHNYFGENYGLHRHIIAKMLGHDIETLEDAENYLKRLGSIKTCLAQGVNYTQEQLKSGISHPRFVLEKTCDALKKFSNINAHDHLLYKLFKENLYNLKLTPVQRTKLLIQAKTIIEKDVLPAYQKTAEDLGALIPESLESRNCPNAGAYYRFCLNFHTEKDVAPQDILKLGNFKIVYLEKEIAKFSEGETLEIYDQRKGIVDLRLKQTLSLIDSLGHSSLIETEEGWKLYPAHFKYKLNGLKSDIEKLCDLKVRLLLTALQVVDVKIHVNQWTIEEAVDYLQKTTGITKEDAVVEVQRCIEVPGQAVAFSLC